MAVGLAMSISAPASAQVFVDVFAGRAAPQDTPLRLRADQARINGEIVPAALDVRLADVKPSRSTIYGARIGYWFDWFGVAGDVSTLDPDVRRQTVRATANLRFDESVFGEAVTIDAGSDRSVDIPRVNVPTTATLSALAMVRKPGRIEPYAFAGPTYLVTDESIDGNWGVRAGGGLRFRVTRTLSIFGEYRYTHVNADAVAGRIGGERSGIAGSTGDIRVDLKLRNHSAVGGIGLTF